MSRTASVARLTISLGLALTVAACGSPEPGPDGSTHQDSSIAHASTALLKDANGNSVARLVFTRAREGTLVSVSAQLDAGMAGIHGLHVHANDNPANGDGCIADPAQPASTHFVSADGHYNPGGGTHGNHAGDMPALFVTESGSGRMSFVIDHFTPEEIKGKAVILHQSPDNYGNVPVGTAANQYTPNAPDATTLTQNTGNAGVRIACGVIQ